MKQYLLTEGITVAIYHSVKPASVKSDFNVVWVYGDCLCPWTEIYHCTSAGGLEEERPPVMMLQEFLFLMQSDGKLGFFFFRFEERV